MTIQLPAIDGPVRLGVLISGGGTTLLNFLDCIRDGSLNAEVGLVVASRTDCKGVQRAQDAGLDVVTIRRRDFDSLQTFSGAVFERLKAARVELVAMAGYLSLLQIPADFQWKVLNIHPSLIPSFCGRGMYGHHVHQAVVDRGVKVSGCTVHFADNEYDHGPIVVQRSVDLPEGATADDVAQLVFEQERQAYPEAIRRVASGNLQIVNRQTRYKETVDRSSLTSDD